MPQQFEVDFNKLEPYEIGAVLLTLLAYPDEDMDEERADLHASLCSQVLYERAQRDPEWANTPQRIKPVYACRSEASIKDSMKKRDRLLRDRAVAGRMAIALLQAMENDGRLPETLPEGVTKLTLEQLAAMVSSEVSNSVGGETENIENRIWRPSLPVVHIAAAMQVLLQGLKKGIPGLPPMDGLWTSREAIIWLVEKARYFEELIVTESVKQNGKVLIKPEKLIKIRLAQN